MPANYNIDNPVFGSIDLDEEFITDAWLVDRFVGNQLWAWGYNSFGQIGNSTSVSYSSPVQIGSLANWTYVSSGGSENNGSSVLAIKSNSTLWAWGYNGFGQLGNSTITSYSSPIQIGSSTDWKIISSGGLHSAAVKTDGTLWTWGYNATGQLGNSTITRYSSPIQIGSLTNWRHVSASGGNIDTSTMALKTDGTLWAWGKNGSGQLGNSTITDYSSPIQIGSLTNWKDITIGFIASLAIKTDGTLWAWGRNNYGQLGNNTTTDYSSPIQIGSLTNWKKISGATIFSAAIKTDGTLWCWGRNNLGYLGNSTTTDYSSPIQIGSLTNWKVVSSGEVNTHAVKTDGTLWAWGYNGYGQLGNSTITSYSSPIQIGALSNWKSVSTSLQQFGSVQAITFTDLY